MNSSKNRRIHPHERGFAWAAAFLMTLFLAFCLLFTLLVQALTSAGLHAGTATDESILNKQERSIFEYIDLLSEEYGFSPDSVKAAIHREDLKQFNLNAAAWWTRVMTEGDSGTVPRWYSAELEEAVLTAMAGVESRDDPRTIAAELSEKIDRTVFPLRETLLTTGLDFVNDRVDVPGVIRSVRKLPLLFLMLTLLAAGLIALMTGREIFRSLKYYGTALAGAGIVMITAGITILVMQPKAMLAQASDALAGEFGMLIRTLLLEGGGATILLLLLGFFCLFVYRHGGIRKNKGETETAS